MIETYRLAVVRGANGHGSVVVERGGRMLPLSVVVTDSSAGVSPSDLMPLLENWAEWTELLEAGVEFANGKFAGEGTDARGATFLPPIAMPGKIVCIGSNYHDHIAEMAIPMTPTYPYSFLKPANNTIRASGDPVAVPRRAKMMDWEAELAVVIGRKCIDVSAADALKYVAGYANFNDLSARDWLANRPPVGIDWVQHKAFDGFAPMGPYLLPARFVQDPQDLPVRLSVNGHVKQQSTTAHMVFGVAAIIEHLSSIMTLLPGDVIATGTPAGVGHGAKPPQYLHSGDQIRMEIGELGELYTPIS